MRSGHPLPRRLLFSIVLLLACRPPAPPVSAGEARATEALPAPVDGVACVGQVDPPPAGAREVADDALLRAALGATGDGKLCTGRVFEAARPIAVYRIWSRAKPYTEIGRWWSLARPTGTVERYRVENAICPAWSDLDVLSTCEIKAGARFVIGPGQSARCDGGAELGKSPVNQVYLDNDTRVPRVLVENCRQLGAWPEPTSTAKP